MCGLFGLLLYCLVLCEGLLCVGGWVEVESRCGHVSILWFEQNVQLGFGYVNGQKMLF